MTNDPNGSGGVGKTGQGAVTCALAHPPAALASACQMVSGDLLRLAGDLDRGGALAGPNHQSAAQHPMEPLVGTSSLSDLRSCTGILDV